MGRRIRNLNTAGTSGPLLSPAAINSRVYSLISSYLAANVEANQPALSAREVSPSALLQVVQSSDAALRRLKKNVVEKSIDNALRQIILEEREAVIEDSNEHIELDSDLEGVDESCLMEVKDSNAMNKGIVGLWDTGSNTRQTTVEIPDNPVTASNDSVVDSSSSTLSVQPVTPNTTVATAAPAPARTHTQPSKKRDRGPVGDGSSNKRSKGGSTADKEDRSPPMNIKLSDIGGMDHIVAEMLELVGMPIMHPEIYLHTGIHPPRGVLLHGPPGCGKTMLANAIAGELGVPFISLSAPSIVSGMSGESEKRVREIFDEARSIAPCLIFLDEIDAITPKRESAQREMERRIVAQLLTCMDDLSLEKTDGKVVMIIGATNRPDSLDPALRRAGRFDREIQMSVPDEISRESILRVLSRKLRLSGEFDFKALAKMTAGYVGADLSALTTAAGIAAIKRIFRELKPGSPLPALESGAADAVGTDEHVEESSKQASGDEDYMDVDVIDIADDDDGIPAPQKIQHNIDRKENSIIQQFLKDFPDTLTAEQLEPLSISIEDFLTALPSVQPSSKREGFATIPDITWADVGALERVRIELQMAIVQPIRRPELYAQVGITAPAGVLLWGPPGCGKTLLAKAVANESRANFISVRGPELLNKFVGESERAVRQVFLRARASVPCVIFFDELDALVPKRDDTLSESSARVVNTLLTELDGLNDRNGIYVIAATNRPDIIDPAMLRPGRLDKPLFVELPTAEERAAILRTVVGKNTPIDESINLDAIGADLRCRNFSGADLAALVREAAVGALRKAVFALKDEHGNIGESFGDVVTPKVVVTADDFEAAFKNVKPSVSDKDRTKYERLGREYGWKQE
ncbi:P-loop containing nucleoside triphosphate hydrolase protein [Lipomyces kononenkoae]|uniref:P-loop containing nucleoside triphosphate hydrolase protein n=1 Tax=Lipomyces kononenkoae TaxID=34357 RepID=A0ACC3T0M2_LIPKO